MDFEIEFSRLRNVLENGSIAKVLERSCKFLIMIIILRSPART